MIMPRLRLPNSRNLLRRTSNFLNNNRDIIQKEIALHLQENILTNEIANTFYNGNKVYQNPYKTNKLNDDLRNQYLVQQSDAIKTNNRGFVNKTPWGAYSLHNDTIFDYQPEDIVIIGAKTLYNNTKNKVKQVINKNDKLKQIKKDLDTYRLIINSMIRSFSPTLNKRNNDNKNINKKYKFKTKNNNEDKVYL